MDIHEWDQRYRSGENAKERSELSPNPLLASTAAKLPPGKVLDLACGRGRNAVWLARQGWNVTAVDGSPAAIELLRQRAQARGLAVETLVADLECGEYRVEPDSWDFIVICFYLQVSLLEAAKRGVRPGGLVLVIVHLSALGEQPTRHQLRPGELKQYFSGWEILHDHEGPPDDPEHKRLSAEIVARRPFSRA